VKPGQLITLGFALGLLSLAADTTAQAETRGASAQASGAIYLAVSDDDEEDDEEEEATNYRDRVREVQGWMKRRDSERKGAAPGLDVAPTPASPTPYPRYFQNKGYDESGYRRLDSGIRVRLHDAPHHYYHSSYHRRHSSWRRHSYHHSYSYRHGSRHGYHRHPAGRHAHGGKPRYHHATRHGHPSYSRHAHGGKPHYHSTRRPSHAWKHHAGHHYNRQAATRHAYHPRHAPQAHAGHAKPAKKGRSRR